ncbi:pancreatic secretory granule membrane major glycoprotein GP2-like [Carassius carassius]|uniref:pancreatic secretory granule membrane major glycoprotein GP2-like n=1 Tax=Carassius carassius TaxID=217509 RepID=UPI002868C60C|nr:pancreatic secretory granule membrane major glycoprotein GP2-like [Carassius carassius]
MTRTQPETNLSDPCYNYTVLDEPWRATSNTYDSVRKCDQSVTWSGWYRLFINGLSAHIPDTCVARGSCGTDIALWIHGGHPAAKDGVVTRDVCGYYENYCCYIGSFPIKVKACPGNYYVYELVSPTLCNSAYCAAYPTVDPCYNYTVLDDPWRANSSQLSNSYKCDQSVTWSGWYRLFINGLSAQIPDTCVAQYSCGTNIPLWIRGGHPTVQDGVVTRDVCGHWKSYCCYYGSYPIKVKACPGSYYVYELVSPTKCSAYCADL